MAKFKFKTRELFTRYPALDRLRTDFCAFWSHRGTRFWDVQYRRMRVVSPQAQSYVYDKAPALYAVYHGSMIGLLGLHPRRKLTILISNSRDGEIIARACHEMGFSTARGSAGRGGVKGTLELIDASKQGQSLAFMVDGPRGPGKEVKIGVIRIAQMTGLPIIPMTVSARTAWWTRSWDTFNATSWASPMLHVFGDPLSIPASAGDEELERLRLELEQRMLAQHEAGEKLWSMTDGKRKSGFVTV